MNARVPAAVRLVIGFSPGSLSDNVAQALAAALRDAGITPTIERRTGGDGVVAARAVMTAAADGTTLLLATLGTHAIAPLLSAPYDPGVDFTPVSLLTQSPLLLACHPRLGLASVGDLIERARAAPRTLRYATSAVGGAPHLAGALFEALTATRLHHVRYARTARLYAELEAGAVDLSFNNINTMLPRCRAGRLVALGVTAGERCAAAPEVATLAEAGVAGYAMSNWTALVAPPRLAPALAEALAATVGTAFAASAHAAALRAQGIAVRATAPGELAAFMAREATRWRAVVPRLHAADSAVS